MSVLISVLNVSGVVSVDLGRVFVEMSRNSVVENVVI